MNSLHKFVTAIIMLDMITKLVTTPEQRQQWQRNYDHDYYASRFSD